MIKTAKRSESDKLVLDNQSRADYLEAIMSSIADGFVTIDKFGRILSSNPAADEMFGYQTDELIGKNVGILINHTTGPADHDKSLQNYNKTGNAKLIGNGSREVVAVKKNGESFHLEIVVNEICVSGTPVFIGVMRDISLRIQERQERDRMFRDMQEARRTIEEQSQNLLKQSHNLMIKANEAIEARNLAVLANRAKSAFLANMSHELRTPLNAIIGFSQIIREGMFGPLSDRYKEYGRDIENSGQHLLSIIGEILDISKVEAGNLTLDETVFDFSDVVDTCIVLFQEKCSDNGIRLVNNINQDFKLKADELRIKQILINLVNNSIKFTENGGEIILTHKICDKWVTFSVEDNGIGIPANKIADITEPFVQAHDNDSFAKKYKGTGLGLSIVKVFTEKHGGDLNIQSTEGVGTKVSVKIPIARLM